MKIERKKISELSEDPNNVRSHGPRNMEAITASLRKFGQQKPVVITSQGIILAGNATFRAAKELGWEDLDVVVSDLQGINSTLYAIADNRTAELAEWDDDDLLAVLSKIPDDLRPLTGFSDDDFDALKAEALEFDEAMAVEMGEGLPPEKQYLLIFVDDDEQWRQMIEWFKLKKVRRGGSSGSKKLASEVSMERVVTFDRVKEAIAHAHRDSEQG